MAASMALGGCISSAPRAADNWTIEFLRTVEGADGDDKRLPGVRISHVTVRAPYDGTRLAVMRANGSLAFDSYNAFAAAPGQLLRGAVQDAVEASGVFSSVYAANSSALCDMTLETTVTRLALDCRKEGRRDAVVELTLVLLKGREAVCTTRAEGKAASGDGDYSAAFSRALGKAVRSAMDEMDKWDSSQQ